MAYNHNPTNLHTHTTFCDGKNTPEENVKAAISKNFSCLGFSAHSLYPHWLESNMRPENFESYCTEIKRLKEEYSDKIEIRLGFEADFIPGFCKPDFDYYKEFKPDFLIGSVHFLYNGEPELSENLAQVDNTPELLMNSINTIYKGSVRNFVCHYFSTEREMLRNGSFTIIGHPDLVRKFNGTLRIFTEDEDWYKNEIKETVKAIKKAGVIAEINTGAISRGYMKTPYPSLYFLSLLNESNVPVTLSSDAHSAENLDCAFDAAIEYAKKAGFREIAVPESGSFRMIPLS